MIKLKEILKLFYKGQYLVIGTPNARCYEGYADEFDLDKLLDEEVLLIDGSPNGNIYVTVGKWS